MYDSLARRESNEERESSWKRNQSGQCSALPADPAFQSPKWNRCRTHFTWTQSKLTSQQVNLADELHVLGDDRAILHLAFA